MSQLKKGTNGAGRNGPSGKVTKEKKKGNQPGPLIRNGEKPMENPKIVKEPAMARANPLKAQEVEQVLVLPSCSCNSESGRKEYGYGGG